MNRVLPLDVTVWDSIPLEKTELDFLASATGIYDEKVLKEHVLTIQANAYKIFNFHSIRLLMFARSNRVTQLPAYERVMPLLRERPDAIMLELGCCFGTDLRKVAADGFPVDNLIGSDLYRGFWDFGHKLFKSTPETFPVAFVGGDIFDPSLLALAPVATFTSSVSGFSPPALSSLTSLTPLNGHVSVLYASYFFHIIPSRERQAHLAALMAGLLSPLPGSMIFGVHIGRRVAAYCDRPYQPAKVDPEGNKFFCHSPESWIELWEGIFPLGTVRVEVKLKETGETAHLDPVFASEYEDGCPVLVWSVTRL